MTFPRPNVKYLVRNVDYSVCLQRGTTASPAGLTYPSLRPERDEKLQHWIFRAGPSIDNLPRTPFRIHDAYPADFDSALQVQLAMPPPPNPAPNPPPIPQPVPTVATGNMTGQVEWLLVPVNPALGNTRCYIFNLYFDPSTSNYVRYILATQAYGHGVVGELYTGALDHVDRNASYQWDIAEVTPAALPRAANTDFRIRTLNGAALQLVQSGTSITVNLEPQDRRGPHRVFTITDFGNGKCTILHTPSGRYFCAHDKGSFDWIFSTMTVQQYNAAPAESDVRKRATWKLQRTLGDFHYITTDLIIHHQNSEPLGTFSLALDQGNAILKVKKPAHNQFWLLEPDDALLLVQPIPTQRSPSNQNTVPSSSVNAPAIQSPNNQPRPINIDINTPPNPVNNNPNPVLNTPASNIPTVAPNPGNSINNSPLNSTNTSSDPENVPVSNAVPPELVGVDRRIRNTGNGKFFIRMFNDQGVYRASTHDIFTWVLPCKMENRPNGALISCNINGTMVYLGFVNGQVRGLANDQTHLWRVERSGNAFFIVYINSNLVLSVAANGQKNQAFTLENKSEDPRKLWVFVQ